MGIKFFRYHILVIKGLIIFYIFKLIEQKNDKPHCIEKSNVGMVVSILFSLFVQLVNVILA